MVLLEEDSKEDDSDLLEFLDEQTEVITLSLAQTHHRGHRFVHDPLERQDREGSNS